MQTLKMAVIGAGRLGGFHAQKLRSLPQVELLAVVDPSAAARERVAAQCGTQALADHRALLGVVDAAVIASPTRWHHALAIEFLAAGAHLLVEKPLCTTRAEAEELVALARRKNLVLQVGHVERFNPAFAAAAAQVPAPKYIEAVRAGGVTFRSLDVGVVLDLMIHDIDLVLSLVRAPLQKVEALGLSVLGGHEDIANARLQFQCGSVATLSASRVSYEPVRRMQLWGVQAFAGIDFAARTTTIVRPSETLLRRQFHADRLTPEQAEQCKDHWAEEHLPRQVQCFAAVDALALELQDFVEAVRTRREPRVSGEAGRDALAVAEQILACIEAHAWDGTADGPAGPLAQRRSSAVPAPHFQCATGFASVCTVIAANGD
ncbi:MAG: Gfo/Idh/MocA family oxidoreductase [Thermoguttaceae bacterium]|jgi:predicted dehydrogenase